MIKRIETTEEGWRTDEEIMSRERNESKDKELKTDK